MPTSVLSCVLAALNCVFFAANAMRELCMAAVLAATRSVTSWSSACTCRSFAWPSLSTCAQACPHMRP